MNRRALQILRIMAGVTETSGHLDEGYECEIVCEGASCWFGMERIRRATVDELLACMAISDVADGLKGERYGINGTGKAIARRPFLAHDVRGAVFAGRPFTIVGDEVVRLSDD